MMYQQPIYIQPWTVIRSKGGTPPVTHHFSLLVNPTHHPSFQNAISIIPNHWSKRMGNVLGNILVGIMLGNYGIYTILSEE